MAAALRSGDFALLGGHGGDLAANPGPVEPIEVDQLVQLRVMPAGGAGRHEAPPQLGSAGQVQVHGEVGQVRSGIGIPEPVVEFDAVEDLDATLDARRQADVIRP